MLILSASLRHTLLADTIINLVDFEGRFTDTAVQNALRGIREEAIALKILGTY